MQFSIIGEWLIKGESPNTGLPVLETRRIVKAGEWLSEANEDFDRPDCVFRGMKAPQRAKYAAGDSFAIQLGRGKKAVSRTNKLASIQRQDVRDMTLQQAVDSGFKGSPEYLMAWTKMHDVPAYGYAQCDLLARACERQETFDSWVRIEGAKWFRYLKSRPAEKYDAWVLRFERE